MAAAAEKWEQYFLRVHLDDVLNTGCFTGYNFRKSLSSESTDRVVYISEYYCPSEEVLAQYNHTHAPALKQDIMDKFAGQFTASRTVYALLGQK